MYEKTLLPYNRLPAYVTVFAHEYILLAAKYRLKKGETLEMHLFSPLLVFQRRITPLLVLGAGKVKGKNTSNTK